MGFVKAAARLMFLPRFSSNGRRRSHANGGTVPVIAVDIGGAFDRVSHSGVVHKIQQAGATGFLIAWLRDYVADRNIQVAIGGKISAQHSIRAGDPQGSVLGPTHVADIDKCLVSDTRLSSFADDTMVYSLALSNDLREKVAALQQTLDNLHDLGRKWRIRFEPAESQLLVISKARQKPPLPPITFGGTALQLQSTSSCCV